MRSILRDGLNRHRVVAPRYIAVRPEVALTILLTPLDYPSAEVARALAIIPRTAEHHAERALRKLRAHARAQVGPKLRGG